MRGIALLALLVGGCASSAPPAPPDVEADDALIDRTQRAVETLTDSTAMWFDSLFGSDELDTGAGVTRGRLSLGTQWDERDGTELRVRLKGRMILPALEHRTRLIFGRADADDVIEGTGSENIDTLPARFNDFNDEDWLLGFGYARDGALTRGWDFGVGLKLATPVEPYARVFYRWHRALNEAWLWRLRPQLFWKSERGAGVSLTNTLDHAASSRWLFRSWSILVADQDTEGTEWNSKLTAYQRLPGRSALAYSIFAAGETGADVHVQDYGIELRYRRPVFRPWLFLELLTNHRWPRETTVERRTGSFGIGFELEMQFGDGHGAPE